jgi:hypothetical protein
MSACTCAHRLRAHTANYRPHVCKYMKALHVCVCVCVLHVCVCFNVCLHLSISPYVMHTHSHTSIYTYIYHDQHGHTQTRTMPLPISRTLMPCSFSGWRSSHLESTSDAVQAVYPVPDSEKASSLRAARQH